MGSRTTDMKKKMLRDYGGTPASEAAVTEALKWFSRHQMPNGGWTYQHDLVRRGRCGDACDASYNKSYNAATARHSCHFSVRDKPRSVASSGKMSRPDFSF